jgi:hypothetical protein
VAAPEILEAQAKGAIKAVSLDAQHPAETVKLGKSGQGFRLAGGAPKAIHLQIYGY